MILNLVYGKEKVLKKKLFLIYLLITGIYTALIFYSSATLKSISKTLEEPSGGENSFFKTTVDLSNLTKELNFNVAQAFVYDEIEDVKIQISKVESEFDEISQKISIINDKKFDKIQSLELKDLTDQSQEKNESLNKKYSTIGDIIKSLHSQVDDIKKNSIGVIQSKLGVLERTKKTQESHELTHNLLRKIDFSNLTSKKDLLLKDSLFRSTFTVVYSNSTRNLNFVGRSKFERATKYFDTFLGSDQTYLDFKKSFMQSFDLAIQISSSSAGKSYFLFQTETQDFNRSMNLLVEASQSIFEKDRKDLLQNVNEKNTMTLILAAVALILGILIVSKFVSQIVNSLRKLSDRIDKSAVAVGEASQLVSGESVNLTNSSEETSNSLEQTVSSMEELTAMVSSNSDSSAQASGLATQSMEVASQAENEIKNLIASIKGIADTSSKIEEITNVIDDIAFQTNLLALNAAVEAARAGDQGKGFAAVADAVRDLAQKCGDSAKEINSIIKENVSQTTEGAELADKAGTILSEILKQATQVESLNKMISEGNAEQSKGIDLISTAMLDIEQSTKKNMQGSSNLSHSAHDLNTHAQTMKNEVLKLKEIL